MNSEIFSHLPKSFQILVAFAEKKQGTLHEAMKVEAENAIKNRIHRDTNEFLKFVESEAQLRENEMEKETENCA
jgi:hypothetical protein